ncbi:MAG: ABC transporter substrate-binding protein [Alphaproteobacteria bacterium]|nr:ABC transporter substrate-binding protein [Alphaproteobacteria bacterium]
MRAVTAILSLAILTPGMANPAWAQSGDRPFRFGVARAVPTLDPFHTTVREATLVAGPLIFDTLIWRDPKSDEFKPQLAQAWQWVDDVTLDITLRTDMNFHDGKKFSADDVVYTIRYALDPASKVAQPSFITWISSIEKVADDRVRIKLVRPFGPALDYLANLIPIMPTGFFENSNSAAGTFNGTGPYKLVAYEPGRRAEFELTGEYPSGLPKSDAKLKSITMRVFSDKNAELGEFLSGNLDWIWQFSSDQARRIRSYPNIALSYSPTLRVRFLEMDASGAAGVGALKDLRVRRAIAHAINADKIRSVLTEPGTQAIEAVCYPSQVGCQKPAVTYAYDPAKAKQLLAEAGYANGFTADFYTWSNRTWTEAMAADLAAVGIKTNIKTLDFITMMERRRAGETPLIDNSWGSNSINDASAVLDVFFGRPGYYLYKDDAIADRLDLARQTRDTGQRLELYKNVIDAIAEKAYAVPLFAQSTAYAYNAQFAFEPFSDEIPRFYSYSWKSK